MIRRAHVSLPYRGSVPTAAVEKALRQLLGDAPGRGWVRIVVEREIPTAGPGTELKKLLRRWLGIVATPNCPCNQHAEEMDRRGCDWCANNLDTIVGWLRDEAARRKLPFVDAAGRLVVTRAIASARRTPRPPTSAAPQARTKN